MLRWNRKKGIWEYDSEKEKEEYYAYKKTNGNSYIWEVYKKR